MEVPSTVYIRHEDQNYKLQENNGSISISLFEKGVDQRTVSDLNELEQIESIMSKAMDKEVAFSIDMDVELKDWEVLGRKLSARAHQLHHRISTKTDAAFKQTVQGQETPKQKASNLYAKIQQEANHLKARTAPIEARELPPETFANIIEYADTQTREAILETKGDEAESLKAQTEHSILHTAQKLGYKGPNIKEAKRFTETFHYNIEKAIKRGRVPEHLIARTSTTKSFKIMGFNVLNRTKRSIDPQATLDNIIKNATNEDLFTIFSSQNMHALSSPLNSGEGMVKFDDCLADYILENKKNIRPARPSSISTQTAAQALFHSTPSPKSVELMLKLGVNPNVDPGLKGGFTPLCRAAHFGHTESVKMLVNAGADINQVSTKSKSPVLIAARKNRSDVVKYLLENGASPNKMRRNRTVGPDLYSYNRECRTLLEEHGAMNRIGYYDPTLKVLVRTPSVSDQDLTSNLTNLNSSQIDTPIFNNSGRNLLGEVIQHGKSGALPTLLSKAGVNPNKKNFTGESPLHYAAFSGNLEAIKTLESHGGNPHAKTHKGNTPANYALRKGHADVAKHLLKKQATLAETKNSKGQYPIHQALLCKDIELLELVLKAGVNVNAQDADGNTALHMAINEQNKEMVKLLLKYGANPEQANNNKTTANKLANYFADENVTPTSHKWTESQQTLARKISKLILDAQKERQLKLDNALASGENEKAKDFLEQGMKPTDEPNTEGNYPVHMALQKDDPELLEMILKSGVDVNAINGEGKSALALAFENNNQVLIKILLHHGAG